MDSPLALVAIGLFAVCAVLIAGRRESAASPRIVAGRTRRAAAADRGEHR